MAGGVRGMHPRLTELPDARYHQEHPVDWPAGTRVVVTGDDSGWIIERIGGPVYGTVLHIGEHLVFKDCVLLQLDASISATQDPGRPVEVQWPAKDLIRVSDLPDGFDERSIEVWLAR